jgi:hypothetical protein
VRKNRIIQALSETQRTLEKLETAYARRPDHLRTEEDQSLIDFYRNHAKKLTGMLEENKTKAYAEPTL